MMHDEPGAKPLGVDIEKAIAPEPEKAGNGLGDESYQQVEPPDYTMLRQRALTTGFNPPPENRGKIIQQSFDPTVTVPEYIRGTLEQLNVINRFLHGHGVQRLQREQVMKLTKELFRYQFQDMQHVLLLGMDVQKKERFVQYMNANKNLQSRIQQESAEAQLAIVETMFQNTLDAFKAKNRRDMEFGKLYKDGVIDRGQYERSIHENQSRTDDHLRRLEQTMELLIQRHGEFLYKTLELFKTSLIEGGRM